jgi:uncharacterized protein (AIM24 family)
VARVVRFPTDEIDGLDEEFLYHLGRGGEHLARHEPEAARTALVRAAEMRPRDPKVLGLLGQACYRIGRFGEAAEAYGRLLEETPLDPRAQVNLGLALLKASRTTEAIVHLERALDLNPEHRRAMGYLGLAWLDQGNVARAREWFERAGREQMVARCDVMLRASQRMAALPGPPAEQAPPAPPRPDVEVEQEVQDALRILEQGARSAAGAPANGAPTSPSAWTSTSPAGAGRPRPGAATRNVASAPPSVAAVPAPAPAAVARPPAAPAAPAEPAPEPQGEPSPPALVALVPPTTTEPAFTVGRLVRVVVAGEVLVRAGALLAVEGQVELAPEPKRLRGRVATEPFGSGGEAMARARGAGALVFAPRGRRFTAIELEGGAAHFRQGVLFAFEASLVFENERLAAPGAPDIELVRLGGQGAALVASVGELLSLEVAPGRPVRVDAAAVVGWASSLTPRLLPLVGAGAEPDAVELTGQGRVLLDPGAALA